jgi:hypothetical protein
MSVKSCAWWAALAGHGVPDRGLAAAPAAVGGDPLDVVIVQVADVNPAVYAGVGAFVLVVVLLCGWVHVGCARLLCGHEVTPSWSGPRELRTPRGHILILWAV